MSAGRMHRRYCAKLEFLRRYGAYWVLVSNMLAGGQLRLERRPGSGRRYRVVSGTLTIPEAVRAAKAQHALEVQNFWRASNAQVSLDGGWFSMDIELEDL